MSVFQGEDEENKSITTIIYNRLGLCILMKNQRKNIEDAQESDGNFGTRIGSFVLLMSN